jgi:hypothetical protein
MTMQYEQRNINLQGVQAVSTLIFNSNLTEQTDIAFNDWDALLAKAQEIPGIVRILITGTASNTIPAGTYDMTDIVLAGSTPFATVEVNDAIFENLESIDSLTMAVGSTAANTVATFQYNSGTGESLSITRSTFVTGVLAVAPMFEITAGTSLALRAYESAFLSANAGVPLITVDATSVLVAGTVSGVAGNTWGGATGSPAFVSVTAGGTFSLSLTTGDIFWASNQVLGPTSVPRGDDYESAVVGDWSGVEPLNVKTALDRIAAATGPIA